MGPGIILVGLVAVGLWAMSKHEEPIKRAVNVPGLTVQDVVAGFVAAQNNSIDTLDRIAKSVPGTSFAGALQTVITLIRGKNLPAGTSTMSGALVSLVSILINFTQEPEILNLYAQALDAIKQPEYAQAFRTRAADIQRANTRPLTINMPGG